MSGETPVPIDDGLCDHLKAGLQLPSVSLDSTSGQIIDLSKEAGLVIVFVYPRTGAPGSTVSAEWKAIPGALGCTPQACSFRDGSQDLLKHGVKRIFGLSTQNTPYQQEARERLHLPYDMLSDEHMLLAKAIKIPYFDFQGDKVLKRVTLAIQGGKIIKCWYPVFPTDKSAETVLNWLKDNQQ